MSVTITAPHPSQMIVTIDVLIVQAEEHYNDK